MDNLLRAIDKALQSRRWLIALDRDGTLVPYAARPEEARVSDSLKSLIQRLAQQPGFDVAIVSARSCAQLRAEFDQAHTIIAGNYGMEVLFPGERLVVQPQALRAVPYLKIVRDELASAINLNGGAILEDHGYSLCLHWRQVPVAERPQLHEAVRTIAADFSAVRFRSLESSYEALPRIAWDKGAALEFINANLSAQDERRVYFYGGDTLADQPAFAWVSEHRGLSVRVGGDSNLGATFQVASPAELLDALSYMVDRRSQLSAA